MVIYTLASLFQRVEKTRRQRTPDAPRGDLPEPPARVSEADGADDEERTGEKTCWWRPPVRFAGKAAAHQERGDHGVCSAPQTSRHQGHHHEPSNLTSQLCSAVSASRRKPTGVTGIVGVWRHGPGQAISALAGPIIPQSNRRVVYCTRPVKEVTVSDDQELIPIARIP